MLAPSTRRVRSVVKRAEAEEAFWKEHYPGLLERYPEHFVAVYDGKVVYASPELQEIARYLEEKAIPHDKTSLRFVTAKPQYLLL